MDFPGPRRTEVKKSQAVLGAVLMAGLTGLLPGEASASGLELRVGGFLPKLDSILFADSMTLYTVQKDDFNGWFGGGEYPQRRTRGPAPSGSRRSRRVPSAPLSGS